MEHLDEFEPVAKIVVIGVGGAGNNAVNRMIDEEIESVEFYVANTDKQALSTSRTPNRIALGDVLTKGLGAGGDPSVGREAAEASKDELAKIIEGANMVFIAAGMGGGTGTGAAPVIARIAKEAGALTIAIVTRPFTFEGKRRIANSIDGLNNLKDHVDSIIIVSNDKLLMMNGREPITAAFKIADDVLAQSVKTVTDLILRPAIINLDFADVRNTLKQSGISLIGFGMGTGENKSIDAANNAISSPLLEASIKGARKAIVSITCGSQVSLFDAQETVAQIIEAAGSAIDIKFGVAFQNQFDDQVFVSVIATDFAEEYDFTTIPQHPRSFAVKEEVKEEEKVPVPPVTETKDPGEHRGSILSNFIKRKD